jgi:flagellar protein FliS
MKLQGGIPLKKEQLADFTRRVSQSNRSELVVIMYELCFAYLADARMSLEQDDAESFKNAIRKGERMINELIGALDFSYDLAHELNRVYIFCLEALARAMYKRDVAEIDEAERLLRKLYESFEKVAELDTSAPLMDNTEQVFAGYTYDKGMLVESPDTSKSRGFLV